MKKIYNTSLPEKYGHIALLVFRVIAAGFMLTHGIPKLQRLLSGEEIKFADPYGLGPATSFVLVIFAEFLCSILVSLGLLTRLAVIPLMITMATAVIFAHADDPFGVKEKPLLFLLIFALLFVFGSGRYSIDRILERGRFGNQ
ncbi:MAG: DoxX family protein [Cyclobacteriaceae bacterium]